MVINMIINICGKLETDPGARDLLLVLLAYLAAALISIYVP